MKQLAPLLRRVVQAGATSMVSLTIIGTCEEIDRLAMVGTAYLGRETRDVLRCLLDCETNYQPMV